MQLDKESKEIILRRYNNFYDAVILNIEFKFIDNKRIANVVIEAKDSSVSNEWKSLLLTVSEIKEIMFKEGPKHTVQVLSPDGLIVWIEDEAIYLDFSPYTDEPDSLEDIRQSQFMIAGKRCDISEAE